MLVNAVKELASENAAQADEIAQLQKQVEWLMEREKGLGSN